MAISLTEIVALVIELLQRAEQAEARVAQLQHQLAAKGEQDGTLASGRGKVSATDP